MDASIKPLYEQAKAIIEKAQDTLGRSAYEGFLSELGSEVEIREMALREDEDDSDDE